MADKTTTELDDLALRIYAECVALNPQRSGDQLAMDCYRRAESFLAIRDKLRDGKVTVPKPDGMADCRAPNQPPHYPLNMISRQHGDLNKVNRVYKWLDANPPSDDEPALVNRFHQAFPELSWPLPEINRARVIFPVYVKADAK